MKRNLIVYHANCADGLVAAALMCLVNEDRDRSGGVSSTTRATNYGAKDVSDLNRYLVSHREDYDAIQFVDFFPDITTIQGALQGLKVEIYDHHVNNFKMAKELWENIDVTFGLCYDNTMSGAGIVSQLTGFSPTLLRVAELVSDRDTWQFKHGMTSKYLHEYISARWINKNAQPWDVAFWLKWLTPTTLEHTLQEGEVRYDVTQSAIAKHIESYKPCYIQIQGQQIPAYNMGLAWASEASDILAKRTPESGVWIFYQFTGGAVNISVRSRNPTGLRAVDVAEHFGGGGHDNAAGANGLEIFEFLDKQVDIL